MVSTGAETSEWTTIPACLRSAAAEVPDVEAVVDGDVRLTYADLEAQAHRFARAVIARGLRPGDRAAIWAPNSVSWVVSALGVLCAGGVVVPVNTRFKGAEARHVLGKVRANLLVVHDDFLHGGYLAALRDEGGPAAVPSAEFPVPGLPELRTVVTVDETRDPAAVSLETLLSEAESVPQSAVDARIADIAPDDVADVLFTSGTTGFPKGAMVSHRGDLAVDQAWADMVGLRPGDRYLLINPLFHSFGYRAGLLACLIRRATIVPMAVFDVADALAVVQRERITVLPGPPTIFSALLDFPDLPEYDISSLRLTVTGATVVPVRLLEDMRSVLGIRDVLSAYGLTECSGTATICPPETDLERLSTSCGKAIPGTEVAVVAPDGKPLPPGERGEIVIRGQNVMLGYFEDPEATARAVDADGWLRTGDVGWLDEAGFLRVTDRLKDMYVAGGFNVYPAEVERLLGEHPAIAEVAVVGAPDERLGEVGCAHVVLASGAETTEAALISYARKKMANFKVPRRLVFRSALPRNASGKVQKHRLADQ